MPQDTRIPEAEPGPREAEQERREQPPQQEQQEREAGKEGSPREEQEGMPGYGEPPPEVRRHKLPEQDW